MSIDPLAEKYSYQSPYNFAENKVISHRELEGLEGIWFQSVMNADRAANPNGVSAHVMGIAQGLVNSAKGLVNAVANPVQTAKGIGNTALWLAVGSQASGAVDSALGTNSSGAGTALLNGVVSGGNKLVNGNGTQRGAVIGEVAGAIIGAKGINATVNAIGKASTMSSLSNSVRATATELSTSGSVPSTVVGAELNGQTMIATSGAPQSVIAPQLEGVVGELGGIGTKTATGNTVGCCAEFQAGNNLLLENPNALPNQINFTNAIRPRTGQTIPMCDNCKTTFGK